MPSTADSSYIKNYIYACIHPFFLSLDDLFLPEQTVLPKRGRALIWPSVLNDNPHQKDPRTDHEAMPVIKGVKYGANAWQHMRDFKTPFIKVSASVGLDGRTVARDHEGLFINRQLLLVGTRQDFNVGVLKLLVCLFSIVQGCS